jgi:hypothetical protein
MIVLMLLLRNIGSERHFVHVINRPKVLLLSQCVWCASNSLAVGDCGMKRLTYKMNVKYAHCYIAACFMCGITQSIRISVHIRKMGNLRVRTNMSHL